MFCRQCGTALPEGAAFCCKCGTKVAGSVIGPAARPQAQEPDPDLTWLLPIGRSGFAIAAGYLALFSVLLFPAPFAFLFGILALSDIRRHPEKKGKGRAWFGIVMGAIFTLLLFALILGLIVE